MEEKKEKECAFCGLLLSRVKFMVNGPGDLHICNVCIEQCMELWEDFQRDQKQMEAYRIKHHLAGNIIE